MKNNRGINDGKDLPQSYLENLYDRIVKEPIALVTRRYPTDLFTVILLAPPLILCFPNAHSKRTPSSSQELMLTCTVLLLMCSSGCLITLQKSAAEKKGWLKLREKLTFKTLWKRYWFVLAENTLVYFKKPVSLLLMHTKKKKFSSARGVSLLELSVLTCLSHRPQLTTIV